MRGIAKVWRLAKLGITDFETVAAAGRLQNDMLRRLKRARFNPSRLGGLKRCTGSQCSSKKCAEVCQFGARRRRLMEIPAAHRLLRKAAGPVYEVRVGRGAWTRPAGKLNEVSIAAAKKLNRWALDRLNMATLVAVGTFKVSVAPQHEGRGWKCEIHQIIAGVNKKELEKAFSTSRYASGNFLSVREVPNLGQAISDVLKRDVDGWRHPYRTETTPERPKKRHRAEYYEWLSDLKPGDRIVRYVCDRYFNSLKKKPREVRRKIRKGHPTPIWLHRFWFGSHPSSCTCDRCKGRYPLN